MNKAFEKILERLEECQERYDDTAFAEMNENGHTLDFEYARGKKDSMEEANQIVQEVAEEYKDGWIPCSDRLPQETEKQYLVTYREVFFGKFHYFTEIVYLSTLSDGNKSWEIEEADKSKKVIAWQPLPEPYQPKGE